MVDFHRVPLVILAVVVLVTAGSLTYFYTVYREPLGPEYGWGGNSTLAINLTLARTNITINETLNYTITLKNTGPESIRVYIDRYMPQIRLEERAGFMNGTPFDVHSPVQNFSVATTSDPLADPVRFNRRLTVLGPGEEVPFTGAIARGTPGAGGWDIHPNGTYEVLGLYYFWDKPAYPALPCWNGQVYSDRAQFSVLP